ncbi:MAG: U32 family peptidase [Ignavibacteriaceae bacterium]|nr:U32 family peptidase [Ignavibacteriaceae bacterium]
MNDKKIILTKNQPPTTNRQPPELMAPAGDWTMLIAAVNAGANAIYFGVEKLNMRAKAANFTLNELDKIVEYCKAKNVKTYLTLNTIVFEEELSDVDGIITEAKKHGVDAVICWDLAVIQKCREHNMPFCVSTQGSVSNSASVSFYKSIGAKRVVLARECSLEEIKKIRANSDLEIEAFVHGAMCIAVSGRCFMSHHLFGISANRGECIQPCRREFEVNDPSVNKSMILGEDYVMSPKDLCTIEYIDLLIEAGIDSFKIEGRKRSPEYVAQSVKAYRTAIDLYFENKLTPELKKNLLNDLGEVYNRGFSAGFYFEKPSAAEYAGVHGSKATTKKEYAGRVLNYFKKAQAVHMLIESGELNEGDKIYLIGTTTGVVEVELKDFLKDDKPASSAKKGDEITFICSSEIKPRDSVYLKKTISGGRT